MSEPSPMPPLPRPPVNVEQRERRIDEEAAADFAHLSPEVRQMTVARVDQNPLGELQLQLQRAVDYIREPVPIETFIYDDRYLDHSLKGNVYPAIVDDLIKLFEGDHLEVCLGGSWGLGEVVRNRDWHCLRDFTCRPCMRQPAAAFGLIPGSTLVFLNVSVDVRQAQRVLFGGLKRCEE